MSCQLSVSACRPAVGHQGFTRCPLRGFSGKDSWKCRRTRGTSHAAKGTGDCVPPPWVAAIGLAISVAIAYLLAPRLSLALLRDHPGQIGERNACFGPNAA